MLAPVRRRDDFDALSHSRARGRSGPVRVARAPLPADAPARAHVAYAIPRAVGTAVVRNRVRRRLRAMIASLGPAEGLEPALYLVGAGPAAVELPTAELRRHLVAALQGAARRAERG